MDVKGTEPISIKKYVQDKYPSQYDSWFGSLSQEAQKIYKSVVVSQWYPFKYAVIEPLEKICTRFFDGDRKKAKDIGIYNAEVDLSGIYKIFVKFGSPQFILQKSSTIFSRYYTGAVMTSEPVDARTKSTKLRITESEEPNEMHEIKVSGYITKALEIQGCKNVDVQITKSLARGDSETEFSIKWD